MFEIKNLSLSYGNTLIFNQVSMSLSKEEIGVLIGPSGCGKSSFLNIIAGNISPVHYTGQVNLNGQTIHHRQHNMSLVSQSYGLLPWKTVYHNIILPLKIKKLPIDKAKIHAIMARLNIESLVDRYTTHLSGGQKQRVALARAFVLDPLDMMLMDEPFSALDSITREESQVLFMDVWQEKRPTTLFVTHSIDEAVILGKKIVIMAHAPAGIIEILDNPLFGQTNIREKSQFLDISNHIRTIIKKAWVT